MKGQYRHLSVVTYNLGVVVFEASHDEEHLLVEVLALDLGVGLVAALEVEVVYKEAKLGTWLRMQIKFK